MPDDPIVAIACSVLRLELQALREQGLINFPIRFLDSRLHMDPEELHAQMARSIQEERRRGCRVLLIYGDCHAHMVDLAADRYVVRVGAINCGEMLLGKQRYKALLKSGAFLLSPEWTCRWRDILLRFPGLDSDSAGEMIREIHSRFVYLNTLTCPVPQEALKQCGDFFLLPYEIEEVSLDLLLAVIQEALARFDREGKS